VGGFPLHHELELAVAVEVTHARVVRRVRVPLAGRRRATGWDLERHVQVAVGELQGRSGGRVLRTVQDRPDCVGGTGGRPGVEEVGGTRDGRGVHPGRATVDVEGDTARVGAEQPPRNQVAVARPYAD